ncbi:hypothetical protein ATN83_1875 [Raoultella ornithinolytica]|nr:hypothetical protein ATN83_1875 [Raoultella ornithinolytica]
MNFYIKKLSFWNDVFLLFIVFNNNTLSVFVDIFMSLILFLLIMTVV